MKIDQTKIIKVEPKLVRIGIGCSLPVIIFILVIFIEFLTYGGNK